MQEFSRCSRQFCYVDNGIGSTVGDLENVFLYCQARFELLSPRSVPLAFGLEKLRANK